MLHGLFPFLRAEVSRLLFTNRGQELYTPELARLSFLAPRTVQDELAKLEAAELILTRSNGYQRFYRANQSTPSIGIWRSSFGKARDTVGPSHALSRADGLGARRNCAARFALPPQEK